MRRNGFGHKAGMGWLIAVFLASAAIQYVSGQLPDMVIGTGSFMDSIIVNYADENSIRFDTRNISSVLRIPVRVMIIRNIKGQDGVRMVDIRSGLNVANGYFKNAGIQFYIDSVRYVEDYHYSYIAFNHLRKELLTKYAGVSCLNLFLSDSIKIRKVRTYGYTYFPDQPDSNFVFLDKAYARGNSLTTMLGHFMGLLSTHESSRGRELASEKNCAASGDFICDTYADPNLFNEVIDTCRYIGTMRDDNARYFVPSVANLMSNAPDECRCVFTDLQYRRIYYYSRKYRKYLADK